jgi:hypothetical protein
VKSDSMPLCQELFDALEQIIASFRLPTRPTKSFSEQSAAHEAKIAPKSLFAGVTRQTVPLTPSLDAPVLAEPRRIFENRRKVCAGRVLSLFRDARKAAERKQGLCAFFPTVALKSCRPAPGLIVDGSAARSRLPQGSRGRSSRSEVTPQADDPTLGNLMLRPLVCHCISSIVIESATNELHLGRTWLCWDFHCSVAF